MMIGLFAIFSTTHIVYLPLRSVTEIELLFGALFYPQHAHAAYFYLRDPKYSETRPEMKEANNSAESHKVSFQIYFILR